MAACYTLRIITDFSSAHSLRDYPGDCNRLHGHNWKLEVEATATSVDHTGMAIDFRTLKSAAREVAARLDHRFLNEVAPFDRLNPTAENIAEYLYKEIEKMVSTPQLWISAVVLWETERACVRYTEERLT